MLAAAASAMALLLLLIPLRLLLPLLLLLCMPGEEQAKVEVLSGRLTELGQDVDALLASVAAKEDEEEAEELL